MVGHVGANKKANSPLFAFAAIGPGTPLVGHICTLNSLKGATAEPS